MKSILIILMLALLLISGKKLALEISPKLENELCKSAYYPSKNRNTDYVVTTFIDSAIQKQANKSLLESLKEYDADYGCVLIMETSTGKIRSMVNLTKQSNGKYKDTLNYAVYEFSEPGSFIKTFDLMALLEDKKADTSTIYSSHKGEVKFYGKKVRDSHKGGYGDLSLGNAFLYSSNTIFAQAIEKAYSSNPKQFTDKFNQYGLNQDLGLVFANTNNQFIPQPFSKDWSKISLPWISFGYGLSFSPIKILTYYNAIANKGEMVKPLFLSEIKTASGYSKSYSKSVLNPKICSDNTIAILQDLLRKVVTDGTGSSCNTSQVAIAGKTSTTQILYEDTTSKPKFSSGFVGYFPENNPKYTLISIVNNPQVDKSYYGFDVAGMVVKDIAENIKL